MSQIGQNLLRSYLFRELKLRKTKNGLYSLRAFSRDLDESPSAISQIINGKRIVSRKKALLLARKLTLSPQKYRELEKTFDKKDKTTSELRNSEQSRLDYQRRRIEDLQFEVVSDWVYFAVLSLAETDGFVGTEKWVANRLGISISKALKALETLAELKLMDKKGDKYSFAGENICTTDGVPNAALRSRHESNLNDARTALYRFPTELRDFTFITLPINAKRISKAKELIRKFQNDFCEEMSTTSCHEVYEMAIQLFPRSVLQPNNISTIVHESEGL